MTTLLPLKYLTHVLVLILALGLVPAALASGFRDFAWGSSVDEVREGERFTLQSADQDILVYVGTPSPFELHAYTGYVFVLDENGETRLAAGTYIFDQNHADRARYLDDFEQTTNELKGLYGEPDSDVIEWHETTYKGARHMYSRALAEGHYTHEVVWELADETVRARIFHTGSGLMHRVDYLSRELYPRYQAQRDEP